MYHRAVSSVRLDSPDDICPEAVSLLRDKRATGPALREMRKLKPRRQIEVAELMVSANNFTVGYAKCLAATTPAHQLADGEREKEVRGAVAGGRGPDGARDGVPRP
jgi:hypothetical protein